LPSLTTSHAEQIAAKLGITPKKGRKHERVYIRWAGRIIASYGLRRGSRELSHDYVAEQIFITRRQALDLARCPLSRDDYFELLRIKGHIPHEPRL
jgi:hypothetical protein